MAAISTRLPAPLNEWHSPYPAMAKELREAAADLAALKYEQVFHVIDTRYRSNKPLIATTNRPLDELKKPTDTAHCGTAAFSQWTKITFSI